jgi:putative restriction endonuclease
VRYWWVNQGQTYREEREGGYLWSPKRKRGRDGEATVRNPFYEYMRDVAPGDMVFSYRDGHVVSCGLITSYGYDSPKPSEFGKNGKNWSQFGWRVNVTYFEASPFRPKDQLQRISPFLSEEHAPLKADGGGKELYLTKISPEFAGVIIDALGAAARACREEGRHLSLHDTTEDFADTLAEQAGEYLVDRVKQDIQIPETTRLAIVKARIGQGLFREEVAKVESHCRLTGVEDRDHLVASHIKPWKDSDNRERLSGNNGLMLTPTPDHLFDKGFISFGDDGRLLYATRVNRAALAKMKIPEEGFSAGRFSADQVDFLKYHRDYVFKKAIKAA